MVAGRENQKKGHVGQAGTFGGGSSRANPNVREKKRRKGTRHTFGDAANKKFSGG